jgi:hypothetical protein
LDGSAELYAYQWLSVFQRLRLDKPRDALLPHSFAVTRNDQ